ncbi:MAG: hypothetical protein ACRDC6_02750 [Shewanella sp.]
MSEAQSDTRDTVVPAASQRWDRACRYHGRVDLHECRLRLTANQTWGFTYRHLPGFLQDWWQWQVRMTPLVCQRSGDGLLAPVNATGGCQLSRGSLYKQNLWVFEEWPNFYLCMFAVCPDAAAWPIHGPQRAMADLDQPAYSASQCPVGSISAA